MAEPKPPKFDTPTRSSVFESEKEIRIELPFESNMDNMLYIGINELENFSTAVHYHDHFELCFLEHGQGLYKIEKSLYPVGSGELWMTKPNEIHYGLAGGSSAFRLYYMGFKLDRLRSLEAELYRIGPHRVVKDDDRAIKRGFDALLDEIRDKQPFNRQMVYGMFMQLLVTVLRRLLGQTAKDRGEPRALSSTVTALMNRFHEEIRYDRDMNAIAADLHISRSHLAREFKHSTGMTIGEYARSLCLDKAQYDLRETDRTISEIAERLHFSSIHTFSIFFKRHTGVTPSEYRKRRS